jgi:hypothetical protein
MTNYPVAQAQAEMNLGHGLQVILRRSRVRQLTNQEYRRELTSIIFLVRPQRYP